MTSNSSYVACEDFFSLFHSILLVEYIMKTLIEFLICQYRTAPPYYFPCISETTVTKCPGPGGRVLPRETQNKISLIMNKVSHSPFFFTYLTAFAGSGLVTVSAPHARVDEPSWQRGVGCRTHHDLRWSPRAASHLAVGARHRWRA